jgi:hypothetical protein
MALVSVAVASTAALIVLAVRVAAGAETQTMAAVLAAQKMEMLRASLGGTVPAASGSIQTSLPGYADWLDAQGRPAGPFGAVYVRRWMVGPAPGHSEIGLVLVLVSRVARDGPVAAAGGVRIRHRDEALVATLIGRR